MKYVLFFLVFLTSPVFSGDGLGTDKFKNKEFCENSVDQIKQQIPSLFNKLKGDRIKFQIEGHHRPSSGNYWFSDIDNDGQNELIIYAHTSLRSMIYFYLIYIEVPDNIDSYVIKANSDYQSVPSLHIEKSAKKVSYFHRDYDQRKIADDFPQLVELLFETEIDTVIISGKTYVVFKDSYHNKPHVQITLAQVLPVNAIKEGRSSQGGFVAGLNQLCTYRL